MKAGSGIAMTKQDKEQIEFAQWFVNQQANMQHALKSLGEVFSSAFPERFKASPEKKRRYFLSDRQKKHKKKRMKMATESNRINRKRVKKWKF